MKINSLIYDQNKLIPVEVELTLWPGLPGIQFLGLADQHLKESALRIKSAIKAQGFEFPKAQQVLVNLRPSYVKKSSRGLELAVASALLWETDQVAKPLHDSQFFVYGELGLTGEVYEPEDLEKFEGTPSISILTGTQQRPEDRQFRRKLVKTLGELTNPEEKAAVPKKIEVKRPKLPDILLSEEHAELLKLVAIGEYSILLAGPAGSGKTTFANLLYTLIESPTQENLLEIQKTAQRFGKSVHFRPYVKPHHSIPIMSMIGGGNYPMAGEISRAHMGMLILDELLEFKGPVIEALREPLEECKITVARLGKFEVFPADFLAVATTNLCPCGDLTPTGQKFKSCRFTLKKCGSYLERLSGPFLDRFDLMYFTNTKQELKIPMQDIFNEIQKVRQFQRKSRKQVITNKRLSGKELYLLSSESVKFQVSKEEAMSHRRRLATLRVARGFADLDYSPFIELKHFNRARELSQVMFDKLKRTSIS